MKFSLVVLLDSLLDGLILGGIVAIILVAARGPLIPDATPDGKRGKRRRKYKKAEQAAVPTVRRKARLSDYIVAWAMLAVITSSASYAVAGGHGAYGLVRSAVKGFQAVSDPARLMLMVVLNMVVFAAMGAVLWTGIWWISRFLLHLIRRSWAERAKLIHGTIFGSVIGALLGLSVCLNEAIAGKIVGPFDLLF